MIELKNYEIFVEERTSKSGNTYCALFLKLGEKSIFLKFLTRNEYSYILDSSK